MSSLYEAVDKGSLEDLPEAIKKYSAELNQTSPGEGYTPLICAVAKRNAKMVKLLIDAGANCNIACAGSGVNAGYTGVHMAAKNGDTDIITELAKGGADLNLGGSDSWAPLHCAAFAGKRNSLTCLLDNGARIDVTNKHGLTPLMYVANHGRLHEARDLLRRGAKIDLKDSNGDGVLHHALHYQMFKLFEGEYDMPDCQYDVMTALAMFGADPEVKNNEGMLCTEYSVEGVRDVLRILHHHRDIFQKSTTDWNYMTLLSAQIEHFLSVGLPLRHATDLYDAMKKCDKNRLEDKERKLEERKNQGGCPIIKSKKKKPEIPKDGSDPSNGQCPFFNKDKKEDADKPKEIEAHPHAAAADPHKGIDIKNIPKDGSDPSKGQCPFFSKKAAAQEAASGSADEVEKAARPIGYAHPTQSSQCPMNMSVVALLYENRTAVLMCIICFLLGALMERKLKFTS